MLTNDKNNQQWVLQFCHGYDGPFLDCARQYAALFSNTRYKVCTVYLTGVSNEEVIRRSASDEVVFLGFSSKAVRGLKLSAIRAVRALAASREFKFCIAHRFKPTYIALLGTKIPVIGVQHALGVYRRRSRRLLANMFSKRLTLLNVSNAVRDDVRHCLPRWSSARIETLYNRVDVPEILSDQVSRKAARAFFNLSDDAWVIGNVGRLHPDKDQSTLLQGFAKALPGLPTDSILLIMGSGPLEGELKGLAEEMGIAGRVRFTGHVPGGRRYFKAFDVFALTSPNEGFGMVLIEAMAAGVPLISSDSGAGREILKGIGKTFRAGEVEEVALRLIEVSKLSSEEKRKTSEAAMASLEKRFSYPAAQRKFQRLFAEFAY